MAFTAVTVNFAFVNPDGSLPSGWLSFAPVVEMSNGTTVVAAEPVRVQLVAGAGSVVLYATDDAGTVPVGNVYRVTKAISGESTPAAQFFALPHAVTPVDLSALVPLFAAPQLFTYALAADLTTANTAIANNTTAIATKAALLGVAATVTAAGALAVNKHNPVDATAGPLTMTLPTGQPQGSIIIAEKYDSTTNAVTVSGNIRGVPASTDTLVLPHQTTMFEADAAGSWWPVASNKPLASLDGRYPKRVAGDFFLTDYGTIDLTGIADATAALNAAHTAMYAAGGGTLHFPAGSILIAGKITLPNGNVLSNGATIQPTIVWKGRGAVYSGQRTPATLKGVTTLRMTYQASAGYNDAKIVTVGLGLFKVVDMVWQDATALSSTVFCYTTNTTIHAQGNAFIGSGSGTGASAAAQDVFVLGGTNKPVATGYGDPNSAFQGYGSIISDNYFNGIRRAVYGRSYCNQTNTARNFFDKDCGTNLVGGACVEFDGSLCLPVPTTPPADGDYCTANVISGNYFENINYYHGVKLTKCAFTTVAFNGFEDTGGNFVASVRCVGVIANAVTYPTTSSHIIGNFPGNGVPVLSEDSFSAGFNTVIGGPGGGAVFPFGAAVGLGIVMPGTPVTTWTLKDSAGAVYFQISPAGSGGMVTIPEPVQLTGNTRGVTSASTALTIGNNVTAADASIFLNAPAGRVNQIQFKSANANSWLIYDAASPTLFIRDSVSAVMALTLDPGTGTTGLVTTGGGLKVNGSVGFYGGAVAAKQTVSGAKGSNVALASLMTALVAIGLVTDTTTP